MKKLLSMLLAMMFLFAPSLAETPDPFCDIWPMYIDKSETLPTVWEALGFDCDSILMLLDFRSSGEVFLYDILFKDGSIGEMESEIFGGWKRNGDHYTIQPFASNREIDAYMQDGDLIIALWSDDLYCKLSKLNSFDWYKELVRP